jgi:hypothetical protein
LLSEETGDRTRCAEAHQAGVDAVLQHHPVADQVQTEPGPLPFTSDLGIGEPDRWHHVSSRQLGQHPGVDLVGLTRQGGQALHLLGIGDLHLPTRQLERVVDEARPGHRLDDRVDRFPIGGEVPGQRPKAVRVRWNRRDLDPVSAFIERTDVQSLSAQVESKMQHDVWGPPW